MKVLLLLLGLLLSTPLLVDPVPAPVAVSPEDGADVPKELNTLVDGVQELAAVGTPGGVTVFGPRAWPLIAAHEVILSAAATGPRDGTGRVLALTQDGYLAPDCLRHKGTRRFLSAAIQWLAGGRRKPKLARFDGDLRPYASRLGLKVAKEWQSADVLLLTTGGLTPERLGEVRRFLADGGGVLCAVTPWGWQQLTPQLSLAREMTLNRLMAPFGLAFNRRLSSKTTASGFEVTAPSTLSVLLHADRAWKLLQSGAGSSEAELRLARTTVQDAVGALADFEPTLMVPLRRAASEPSLDPSLGAALTAEDKRRELAPLAVHFGNWQLAGPFSAGPLGRSEEADRLLGSKLAVEAELRNCGDGGPGPDLEKSWKVRGKRIPWRSVELTAWGGRLDVGEMDLHLIAGLDLSDRERAKPWDKGAALFLVRRLELDEPTSFHWNIEGSGGLGLFVDGNLRSAAFEGTDRVHLEAELTLAPGVHHIWIRCVHTTGPWRFRFSAADPFEQGPVDLAIGRGVDWLLEHQYIDGSWSNESGYGPGYTAMALFALAKCGLPRDHPALRRGMGYLDAHRSEFVYSLCAEMLARSQLDKDATGFLREGVKRLGTWQASTGLWAYPVHPGGAVLADDLSNTLFVALALDAAAERGVKIPATLWRGLIEGTLSCRERKRNAVSGRPPLGFSYKPHGNVTGSMTVAGLTCLLFARMRLGDDLPPREAKHIETVLAQGLAWMDGNFTWSENPGQANWHYFWIYGIERLGSLLGRRILGGLDWYRSGAEFLLAHQGKGGDWNGRHAGIDSILALLFLKRATAPSSGDEAPRDRRLLTSAPAPRSVPPPSPDEQDPSEQERTLLVHARLPVTAGDPIECWIQLGGDGPDPVQVTWVALSGKTETRLVSISYTQDKGRKSFAMRRPLPTPHALDLVARVLFEDGTHLESKALRIPTRFSEDTLRIAAHLQANLLSGATLGASSSRAPSTPEEAADANCTTNWIAADDDLHPLWNATFRRPVTARRLLLVPRGPSPQHAALSRVTRARITLDTGQTFEVPVDPDVLQPTAIDFGRPIPVRTLEVALLADSGAGATGFSEILLLP